MCKTMDKSDEFTESYKKQQALIELGNVLWDNNWSWTVSKQEVDFAEMNNGCFDVGVATFVNINLHASQLERQNIGYSHISHKEKSMAYNLSRKISVVNALQETMCSFGGEISNKVHLTLQNVTNSKANETSSSTISSKNENKESRSENRSAQIKTNELIKPKSPGKSSRFAPKTFPENVTGPNNNVLANVNFNVVKVPPVPPAVTPTSVDRIIPAQQIPNSRCLANSTNGSFAPAHKISPTSISTFNSKTGTLPISTHPKAPLQQLPSNVIAPIVHDVSNVIPNNPPGNCFNSKPLMKTIFLNQNTISYNNCHIQQDSHMFNNHPLSYQSPNKNSFVNNEWITPTIFHDGFWTENKVKLWANQNDLIHLTPTGDGSKC